MVKSLPIIGICLLIFLPGTMSAQYEKPIEDLRKRLREVPADSVRVRLLVELGALYLKKRGSFQTDLDSALLCAREASALSQSLNLKRWACESTVMVAHYHIEKKDLQQAKDIFIGLTQQYQKTGDKSLEALAWMKMGMKLRWVIASGEAIGYLRKAIALSEQTGEQKQAADALKEIADIHLNLSKLDECEKELLEVIEKYKAAGFKNLHYTYDLLSAVASKKGNMNQALFYALETVKSMEATGDSASAGTFYYRLGRIYSELGQVEKGIEWYIKSCDKKSNVSFYTCLFAARGLTSIGKSEEGLAFAQDAIKRNPPTNTQEKAYVVMTLGDCYAGLKQYERAEKYFLEMIRYDLELNTKDDYSAMLNFDIADFYMDRKRYPSAEPYLKKILTFPANAVPVPMLKEIHHLLFKIDSAKGDFVSAIQHYQMHKLFNDSIFNETKSRQIEELQIQYETEKKERDLKILQSEKSVQQIQLQQANLTKNITFGTGSLLLVILGLLYNRYRLKQRVNKQLEDQQAEINQTNRSLQHLLEVRERLLREIHHRVKNNLQIVMSLLNSQSAYLENGKALTAIRDSQQRIHSISLIHQKLYQSENISLIDMSVYIRELTDYLQGSFDTGKNIRFDLQTEPIELDVTQAVPLGLILNEAISNAVKYAFPNGKTGTVTISMRQTGEDQLALSVADDGAGLPEGFDINKSNSLGMSLMRGLSKQLNGSFELKNENGLTVVVTFEREHVAEGEIESIG
jgi:two-component sensor histidine kinase